MTPCTETFAFAAFQAMAWLPTAEGATALAENTCKRDGFPQEQIEAAKAYVNGLLLGYGKAHIMGGRQ
jgi:hypothetical protein